jgi:hypothetical protein
MPDPIRPGRSKSLPAVLRQIADEQEGGADKVLDQIEVVAHSFEEIAALTRETLEILSDLVPPSQEKDDLITKLESIATHAENGTYNVEGAFELFQYQDIVRQKLEKVGIRLIEASQYVLDSLKPGEGSTPESARPDADQVVAEFFAKMSAPKPPAP